MKVAARRWLPVAGIAILGGAVIAFDLHQYLNLETLRENRDALAAFVTDNAVLAVGLYVVVYAASVTLSLPGATVLTVAGGFLFGAVLGGTMAVLSAVLGAALLFLAARTVVGDTLRARAGPFLRRMEDGFRANAFSYLLFLRLVPAFPFWAVNLAPAVLGVPFRIFVLATAIGIIPGTFVYAAFGAGLGRLFAAGEDINLSDVLSPAMLGGLIGLGVLALLPVLVDRWRRRKAS
jgi:uncharacterized membrane protein YdjX (TVP38/TMEM64 family)